jgi:predicted double-glycine peptidase
VVISVGSEQLTVLDPLVGETTVARLDFEAAWSQMRYLAIVISA